MNATNSGSSLCCCLYTFHRPHQSNNMPGLQLLGFAGGHPAKITVDLSSPHSSLSESFMFQNAINSVLGPGGNYYIITSLSIPSEGGYYNSHRFQLAGSVTCQSDVILGNDWLSACRAVLRGNTLGRPASETALSLPEGHEWSQSGM